MGKKSKSGGDLGRALIKSRFGGGANRGRKMVADNSMLHTTEIQDGYDWGRLNLQSVTEESSFQEFLSTAELTGAEFQAEKLNIKFINPKSNVGLLTKDQMKEAKESHEKYRDELKIPRRPAWDRNTTPEELDRNEREYFLGWRRSLAKLQEEDGLLLTPYEKNLEFWRQLWRVVERSDVVVQIVDGRNPLLFRCEDLEKYVKEVSNDKINMILINKADFLNETQRKYWADYFTTINVNVVFYSAIIDNDNTESAEKNDTESQPTRSVDELKDEIEKLEENVEKIAERLKEITDKLEELPTILTDHINTSAILSQDQLIELFRNIHKGPKVTQNVTTIGLVGYPNVGKSSTINSLFSSKKVSVSATPGKTKHFQTLFLDKDILLCDCPGLVMPSFVYTKAEMIINGILPIDQMRDHVPPVNLVANLIPRHVIEDRYGIMLPPPMEGEDPDRPPTAEELLNTYAYNRGFMTANGQPDNPRASRYILKDFMNGRLLYCHAPPTVDQKEYHTWPERQKTRSVNYTRPIREVRAARQIRDTVDDVDKTFFNKGSTVHIKGKPVAIPNGLKPGENLSSLGPKPWKKLNKHENKCKREKLRRVYAHLDQH